MDKTSSDGRIQRSERSRQLIIEAMIDLINEGNLIPTAQQVADQAGVAIRTVFRHFTEMEKLYGEMDAKLRPAYERLFLQGDRSGSLEQRVRHAAECHANAYGAFGPLMRSTRALLWRSPEISKNYARNQRGLRKDLNDWLPELKQLPAEARESIDAVTSFEFWDRLQTHQGLSKKASTAIVANLVLGLMQ